MDFIKRLPIFKYIEAKFEQKTQRSACPQKTLQHFPERGLKLPQKFIRFYRTGLPQLAWTADTQDAGVESLPPLQCIDFLTTLCVSVKLAVGGFNVSGWQVGQPSSITFLSFSLSVVFTFCCFHFLSFWLSMSAGDNKQGQPSFFNFSGPHIQFLVGI